jgi:hypothetical protein
MSDERELRDLIRAAQAADTSAVPEVAESLADIRERAWAALVPQTPVEFAGHHWRAQRLYPGSDGFWWKVFRDDEDKPVGLLLGHECAFEDGLWKLLVHAADGAPRYRVKPPHDDGCLRTYQNCLLALLT